MRTQVEAKYMVARRCDGYCQQGKSILHWLIEYVVNRCTCHRVASLFTVMGSYLLGLLIKQYHVNCVPEAELAFKL